MIPKYIIQKGGNTSATDIIVNTPNTPNTPNRIDDISRIEIECFGEYGGIDYDNLTSFKLSWTNNKGSHNILLDAGSLPAGSLPADKSKLSDINSIFLTHGHLDHVAGFLLACNDTNSFLYDSKSRKVFSIFNTTKIGGYINNSNFINDSDNLILELIQLQKDNFINKKYESHTLNKEMNLILEIFPLKHCVNPSYAFLVYDNNSIVLFMGDYEAPQIVKDKNVLVTNMSGGSLSKDSKLRQNIINYNSIINPTQDYKNNEGKCKEEFTNKALMYVQNIIDRVSELKESRKFEYLFTECAFSDDTFVNMLYGHITPKLLKPIIEEFNDATVKIIIMHLKPTIVYNTESDKSDIKYININLKNLYDITKKEKISFDYTSVETIKNEIKKIFNESNFKDNILFLNQYDSINNYNSVIKKNNDRTTNKFDKNGYIVTDNINGKNELYYKLDDPDKYDSTSLKILFNILVVSAGLVKKQFDDNRFITLHDSDYNFYKFNFNGEISKYFDNDFWPKDLFKHINQSVLDIDKTKTFFTDVYPKSYYLLKQQLMLLYNKDKLNNNDTNTLIIN